MSKILIIKTSSLGDIVHMLPALTDAQKALGEISFDWVAEKSFADVPMWHPAVNQVCPVQIRYWRKQLGSKKTWQQLSAFKDQLKQHQYDKVVDTQGLIKSAILTRWTQGESWGYDRTSITEPLAALFYQHKASVSRQEHAITRNRLLLATALNYSIDSLPLDYGLANQAIFELPNSFTPSKKYLLAFHATSREDKEWTLDLWSRFIPQMDIANHALLFPWGNERERQRAQYLAERHKNAYCLPKCTLNELAALMQKANAVIGMDTGLMHIAAAFNKPGIALYPVTQPELTGVLTAEPQAIESLGGKDSLNVDLVAKKMLAKLKANEP